MDHPLHVAPKFVPSVAEYVAGFKRIEPQITENQRRMLVNHHASPGGVTSAQELAASVGFADFGGANLQYGQLGQRLGGAMGHDEWWAVGWIVLFVVPARDRNEHLLWVMRENVARALEELGWVPTTSNLFLPPGQELALPKEGSEGRTE